MSECANCAHSIEPTDQEKGHKEVAGSLICLACGEVCRSPTAPAAPAPGTAPPVVPIMSTIQDVESLAKAVATKMASIRNEMIWKDLQRPGVIVQTVDGGYIVENRWGETAVRFDIEQVIAKMREWLMPRV